MVQGRDTDALRAQDGSDRVFEKLDSRYVLMADCKELLGEFDFEVFVVK